MRAALRLFANVKPGQFLEAGAPTGLTGLVTHPSPRSTLLYYYTSTLQKLKQIPESSVYRQSTEALTKHRLAVVEEAKPDGWDAWQEKVQLQIAENPGAFEVKQTAQGTIISVPKNKEFDERMKAAEWDGEAVTTFPEGIRSDRQRARYAPQMKGGKDYTPERVVAPIKLEPEPLYTAEAIGELESRLGAGLLEEVIQVAEGEHQLVDEMVKAKVWEKLEEEAPAGQWDYFERGNTHTQTQKP
ncbi:hypothetical protein BS50DRAFT_489481 [Corynespora cassiicola Philippines]|uniref:Uncharacterized protein n=1 Tax=Corynespora cassiicola Philippines TaxID=1448308 RepID=A0A2T2NUX3_CORCC|nr:hypothetical protein BS50DRAFT_489481 [Corynespora cassiicola Philippines]